MLLEAQASLLQVHLVGKLAGLHYGLDLNHARIKWHSLDAVQGSDQTCLNLGLSRRTADHLFALRLQRFLVLFLAVDQVG